MGNIIIIRGNKDNIEEDIRAISGKLTSDPEVTVVAKDVKGRVIEKASALFVEENLVLVLVDPEAAAIEEIKEQLNVLKEKAFIVMYYTTSNPDVPGSVGGETVILEQEAEKRLRDRVLSFLRRYDKRMTDKAFALLTEKIKDEGILESELMKLVNYVGERGKIESRDVNAVVTGTQEESLLPLMELLIKKKHREAFLLLADLLQSGMHLLVIHSYMVRQIRLLLHTNDLGETAKGVSEYSVFLKTFNKWKEGIELKPMERKHYLNYQKPYYAYKLSQTGRGISKTSLVFFHDFLTELDTHIKRGTKYDRTRLEYGLLRT